MVVAVITTIWFSIGSIRDIIDLFRTLNFTLKNTNRNDADDGTVPAQLHAEIRTAPAKAFIENQSISSKTAGKNKYP